MIAIAVALVSALAMAAGKGGGGHASSGPRPQENLSLNYGKVSQTYTAQRRDAATGQAKGKRQYSPFRLSRNTALLRLCSGAAPATIAKVADTWRNRFSFAPDKDRGSYRIWLAIEDAKVAKA